MNRHEQKCPSCSGSKLIRLGTSGILAKHTLCKDCKSVFDNTHEFVEKSAAKKLSLILSEETTLQSMLEQFIMSGLESPIGGTAEVSARALLVAEATSKRTSLSNLLYTISKYEYDHMERAYKSSE